MYEKELIELANSRAKYLVVGAVAIGLHGHPRATFDLNILPYLDGENLDKIIKALTKLGYHPRQPIKLEDIKNPEMREYWHDKKNLVALSFIKSKEPYNTIDLLLYQPIDFKKYFQRRNYVTIKGKKVYIASVRDLLELKRLSGRDKDKNDIIILERMLNIKMRQEDREIDDYLSRFKNCSPESLLKHMGELRDFFLCKYDKRWQRIF